jgi:methylenetetrahydrofolate reductase (NADPH)
MSGASVPGEMRQTLEAAEENGGADEVRKVGVDLATDLCQRLLDGGVPGLHFYTLNRSTATREIATNLGLLRP